MQVAFAVGVASTDKKTKNREANCSAMMILAKHGGYCYPLFIPQICSIQSNSAVAVACYLRLVVFSRELIKMSDKCWGQKLDQLMRRMPRKIHNTSRLKIRVCIFPQQHSVLWPQKSMPHYSAGPFSS